MGRALIGIVRNIGLLLLVAVFAAAPCVLSAEESKHRRSPEIYDPQSGDTPASAPNESADSEPHEENTANENTKPDPSALNKKAAREFAELDLSKLSDDELFVMYKTKVDELSSMTPPDAFNFEDYEPGKSEFGDTVEGLARIFARLHEARKGEENNEAIKYPSMLEDMTLAMRALQPNRKSSDPNSEAGGRPAERTWEWALTRHMSEGNPSLTALGTIKHAMMNAKNWIYDEQNLPYIAGAPRDKAGNVADAWIFTYRSMQALAFLEGLRVFKEHATEEEKKKIPELEARARTLLSRWADTDYVKGDRGLLGKGEHADTFSQYSRWGRNYSILLTETLSREPDLRQYLPASFKSSTRDAAAEVELVQSKMQRSLSNSLAQSLGTDPNRIDRFGGSNLHTHMVGTNILALSGEFLKSKSGASIPAAVVNMVEKHGGGGTDLRVPYAPNDTLDRNATSRGSAARAVPYFAMKELRGEDTPQNRENLLGALENFVNHSGSLAANVPRGLVHAGYDNLAPYYFSPTLPTAAAAAQLLKGMPEYQTNSNFRTRADRVSESLTEVVRSQYVPERGVFVNPGRETYAQGGMTWTTSLSLVALTTAFPSKNSPSIAMQYASEGPADSYVSVAHARTLKEIGSVSSLGSASQLVGVVSEKAGRLWNQINGTALEFAASVRSATNSATEVVSHYLQRTKESLTESMIAASGLKAERVDLVQGGNAGGARGGMASTVAQLPDTVDLNVTKLARGVRRRTDETLPEMADLQIEGLSRASSPDVLRSLSFDVAMGDEAGSASAGSKIQLARIDIPRTPAKVPMGLLEVSPPTGMFTVPAPLDLKRIEFDRTPEITDNTVAPLPRSSLTRDIAQNISSKVPTLDLVTPPTRGPEIQIAKVEHKVEQKTEVVESTGTAERIAQVTPISRPPTSGDLVRTAPPTKTPPTTIPPIQPPGPTPFAPPQSPAQAQHPLPQAIASVPSSSSSSGSGSGSSSKSSGEDTKLASPIAITAMQVPTLPKFANSESVKELNLVNELAKITAPSTSVAPEPLSTVSPSVAAALVAPLAPVTPVSRVSQPRVKSLTPGRPTRRTPSSRLLKALKR